MKNKFQKSTVLGYGLAVACVAMATWLHLLVRPLVGTSVPFITFFPGVFICALLTGFGPTILAVVLSALSATYWLISPSLSFRAEESGAWIGLILFCLFGYCVAWFAERTRRNRDQAQFAATRLSDLVDSSDDAIIGISFSGVVTDWNRGAEQLYGFTAKEILGRSLYETIVPREQAEQLGDLLDRVRQGRPCDQFTTVRRHKNGQLLYVSKRVSPIHDATGEVVAASAIDRDISQQRASERRRNARLAITQHLAQGVGVEETIEKALALLCVGLEWDAACFWRVEAEDDVLRCAALWQPPSPERKAWREATLTAAVARGRGLAGEAWRQGRPLWKSDVAADPSEPIASASREADLHGAFACPIGVGEQVIGVIELLSHEAQRPDDDFLEMMTTIGGQIGQFVDRREAEKRLQRSERELSDFFENAAIGLHWVGPDGTILRANRAELDLLGYRREEYVGRHIAEFHADEDVIADILRRLSAGEQLSSYPARLRCKDGSIRQVLIESNVLWEDGQFMHTRCFTSDVTERKKLEESLRFLAEASRSLSLLVDYKSTLERVARLAVPNFADWCAVDLLDHEGRPQRVASAHIDPGKVELAEELHRRYPPDVDDPFGVMKVVRSGESDVATEITDEMLVTFARDEEHLEILRGLTLTSFVCVPLKVQERLLGVLTFVAAESRRRYGVDDVAVAEDLGTRAAIAIENARLYQRVRDTDRRKDEFLAMLAHELRNPLVPIRSGLDILSIDSQADDKTLDIMKSQVEHIIRLVDDLLDVSRILEGKIELRKEPVQLASIIQQSVEAVRSSLESRKQSLTVHSCDASVWLHADAVRLAQVLENLLHNASKYTDENGTITVTASASDGRAIIEVTDTGVGIEPDLLPHVFELFTQSSRSLDRSQGGLGIGLTLVERLVEMHQGEVSVASQGAGRGSTFSVRLPTVPAPPALPETEPEVKEAGRRRILVVDDNQGAVWLLSKLLGKLGDHEIDTAYDGHDALQKIRQTAPEIVLLDIGLPGLDGYEVGSQVRQDQQYDPILLVALTGYGQEEDRRRSRDAGFDEHIVKPPSMDQMEAILRHPKLTAS